jgi:SAM-dependent methyltransferase
VLFRSNQYQANAIGWDLGQVSPPIKTYIDTIENKDAQILIPGCGNTYEAEYLVQQGFTNVTVIDIAPTLVENLKKKFANNNNITVVLGDFFEHQGNYDFIIEQTFFCALPPTMRQKYVWKMHQLLKPNGKLIGLLFNRDFDSNPPFGGSAKEYQKLFAEAFYLSPLINCNDSATPRNNTEIFIDFKKNNNAIVNYVNQGYDVHLGDVVSHPTLFKHYPELFNIPTFFLLNDTNDYSFYFSPNPKYIMMFGNPTDMDIRETFIHEIQHAIQDIENYGTGGNLYIADLINSVGGESLKEYLFKKQLAYRLFEKEIKSTVNLWFEEYKVSGLQGIDSLKSLNIDTKEDFISNLKKIFNIISIIYTSTQNSNGVRVIELFVPSDIISILKELREIHASIRLLHSKLRSQGYTDYEISRIQFQTYEYLSGEIESRNVQQISMIDEVLSDYFAPLTSEAIQRDKVSVIYDELISDEKFPDKVKGALERTKSGLYIIHLTEGNSPKTILHEIGHFIHDMIDSQHLNEKYVEKEILKNMGGIDIENNPSIIGEVFVDLLLSYIAKLNLSKEFTEEISVNLKYPNVELFKKEFDEIFLTKENTTFDADMMEYLKYLKQLNNLIDYNG